MQYHETDPLLPRGKPAPEILGSRPQSINDGFGERPEASWDEGADRESRMGVGDVVALLVGFTTLAFALVLVFGGGWRSMWEAGPWGRRPRSVEERADSILTRTPLIDGHNDLAILIRFLYDNHIYEENFTKPFTEGGMVAHVDLPRLKKGKVGGAFWSAFVPCPTNWTDFSDEVYIPVVSFTYNQIDVLKRLQAQYPTHFSPPPNSSTALSAFRSGQLISPLAIEGLHQIGNSLSNLRNYFDLGVRYATLTHNCHNKYADAALEDLPGGGTRKATSHWGGISPDGRALVHEMNRMGMIVDLAHVSQDTMRDVLGAGNKGWSGSAAPIIFSHSSAYALCPHPRNVPDDILPLVRERNGLVMINFNPDFVSCVAADRESGLPDFYPPNATLAHVVEHVKHIGDLVGYDYVGLGSDFDGILTTPEGLEDVSKFPDLVAEMLRQNISDKDASKVVGGNLLRVWAEVDAVALKLQSNGEVPLEDALPSLRFGEMSNMLNIYGSL